MTNKISTQIEGQDTMKNLLSLENTQDINRSVFNNHMSQALLNIIQQELLNGNSFLYLSTATSELLLPIPEKFITNNELVDNLESNGRLITEYQSIFHDNFYDATGHALLLIKSVAKIVATKFRGLNNGNIIQFYKKDYELTKISITNKDKFSNPGPFMAHYMLLRIFYYH